MERRVVALLKLLFDYPVEVIEIVEEGSGRARMGEPLIMGVLVCC
jgi:hypothetical protein